MDNNNKERCNNRVGNSASSKVGQTGFMEICRGITMAVAAVTESFWNRDSYNNSNIIIKNTLIILSILKRNQTDHSTILILNFRLCIFNFFF